MQEYQKLIAAAEKARQSAHAPYSKFKVGAAVLTSSGEIFAGCNVENASYGLTLCAERAAIAKAVSEGEKKFQAIAVVADSNEAVTPCGACRQVIAEFGREIIVVMANLKGKARVKKVSELLPDSFGPSHLKNFCIATLVVAMLSQPLLARPKIKPPELPSAKEVVGDLKSSNYATQMEAKQQLRRYRFKDVAKAMADFAKDPNPDLRIMMAQTMGELGGAEAAETLEKLFSREKDARVRRAILIQLAGLFRDEKAAASFFKKVLFSEPSDDIRHLALTQLSFLKSAESKKELTRVCRKVWRDERYQPSRIFAAVTLKELGEENPALDEAMLDGLQSPSVEIRRRAALFAASAKDQRSIDRVLVALQDADAEVRANLCHSLAASKNLAVIPPLKAVASDKDASVRKSALDAISTFAFNEVGTLHYLNALKDSDAGIRSLAVTMLEKGGDASAAAALEPVARTDPDSTVQTLAKKALATLTQKR